MSEPRLVLAITGASGCLYGLRLLQVMIDSGVGVDLVLSPAATQVLDHELGIQVEMKSLAVTQLLPQTDQLPETATPLMKQWLTDTINRGWIAQSAELVRLHTHQDYNAGIASGSYRTRGMVVCPCSMGTLASLSHGLSSNLIHRAADVHLKERRKLVLVPRETPLSPIALGNMHRLSEAGALVMPAMPGYYHQPTSMLDLVDFIVARVCDHLQLEHALMKRWGEE